MYNVHIAGVYFLHISWSDRVVAGSPFILNVCNPLKVTSTVKRRLVVDEDNKSVIDARKAGAGT